MSAQRLVACRECDLLQALPRCLVSHTLTCARCGAHMRTSQSGAIDRVLPLVVGAAILLLVAGTSPIVSIETAGSHSSTSLLGAMLTLSRQGVIGVTAIVMLTTLIAPSLELGLLVYALGGLALNRQLPALARVLSWLQLLRPWAMLEVFMLGVLVSLVKLGALAHVVPGIGLWCLGGFVFLSAAAHTFFNVHSYWNRLEMRHG